MSNRDIIYAAAGASGPATYIEDVFSTYLYTGNGTFSGETQAIPNQIDLVGNGGMVWIKNRTSAGTDNCVSDTVRGGTNQMLRTNSTAAAAGAGSNISFQSTGFTCLTSGTNTNYTGENYCSWTFREQPKFFDVVTYTGTGSAQNISHNLGSAPGMIIIKRTDGSTNWRVYHRGLNGGVNPAQFGIALNTTFEQIQSAGFFNDTAPTSTVFTVNTDSSCNTSGGTYVAYLFAHDAGGFGTAGTDNIISCGSYTGNGTSGNTINLGFEPQYLLIKRTDVANSWFIQDVMRDMSVTNTRYLQAESSNAETSFGDFVVFPNATGFTLAQYSGWNANGGSYIYMAIRRPMKVPTDATTVFKPVLRTGTGTDTTVVSGFVTDSVITGNIIYSDPKYSTWDRLRGNRYLLTTTTDAEVTAGTNIVPANPWDVMNGFKVGPSSGITNGGNDNQYATYMFARRPGFFDEVCYTGTGTATNYNHNLGVVPELYIIKRRSGSSSWIVGGTVFSSATANYIPLENIALQTQANTWQTPTATTFGIGTAFASDNSLNASGQTYVARLFASCPGVSKVGSYTGNGATQTISCGFTGGARFVMIKRTDATGDWWVWDTARGMIAGTDPRLALNSTATPSNNNWVYTTTGGFEIVTSTSSVNASGGSYIFLAIA